MEFEKCTAIFVINILKFVKNDFLTNALNFVIGTCSSIPGSGPSPPNKGCPQILMKTH